MFLLFQSPVILRPSQVNRIELTGENRYLGQKGQILQELCPEKQTESEANRGDEAPYATL